MNKAVVRAAVREALRSEFEHLRALSRRTRAASSDAETKAEGKYDTRATEENYLADGQAKQAHLVSEAIAACAALGDRAFAAGSRWEWERSSNSTLRAKRNGSCSGRPQGSKK